MERNNYMNLDDMMEPGNSRNSFDLTKDGLKPIEGATNDSAVETAPSVTRVEPIMTGHVDLKGAKSINVNDILPKRENPDANMTADQMAELDAAIDRECERITEFHKSLAEKQEEEMEAANYANEEKEMDSIDRLALGENYSATNTTPNAPVENIRDEDDFVSIPGPAPVVNNVTPDMIPDEEPKKEEVDTTPEDMNAKPSVNIIDGVSNEELFDEEEEEPETKEGATSDEIIEDLKNQIKDKIKPIKKTFDLSKFSITQKAVSAQKVMKLVVTNNQNAADWVLPNAGVAISMTGLSGPEILKLNPENSTRNRLNTFRDMYQVIYDHLLDGNKPEFEAWLKQLRFTDIQHIYFCLYMATFNGSNFVNYSCPKCKKVFLNDVNFKDMVVYADDKVKDKIKSILTHDTTSQSADSYEATMIQISDNYALSIRTPSVWNVIMETATLSEQFLEKYADLIDIITYIDAAYLIDANNQQLIPIDTKPDPNNMSKTAARRIATMYDIISKLSSEEFYTLRSAITELDNNANDVTYKVPGCKCPECGADIPDMESSPSEMLFTRHQLAAIGSM